METPLAIANYFIKKGADSGAPITPMKAVKLTYIAHGWYLGITGNPLIGESVQAWKYGPVIPSLYHKLKVYKDNQIPKPEFDIQATGYGWFVPEVSDPDVIAFLDKIWQVYGNFTAVQLSALTHQPGTPWFMVWETNDGKSQQSVVIPNELIQMHYKQKASARTVNG